jgi:hypothetical protein
MPRENASHVQPAGWGGARMSRRDTPANLPMLRAYRDVCARSVDLLQTVLQQELTARYEAQAPGEREVNIRHFMSVDLVIAPLLGQLRDLTARIERIEARAWASRPKEPSRSTPVSQEVSV